MQFKKLALTLTLSAAFGLMACGDDSSSGPSNSDSGSELQKEFQEVQKEMMEGLEKLGKCTEDTVVGTIAVRYFGKKLGESTYDPVFILAAMLEWAGVAHNLRGYVQLADDRFVK